MTLVGILLLGLAIGAVLGGLGGGGAILTVPALVYVVGQPAQEATTSSLVIVGVTALVGVASYVSSGRVRWKTGVGFGIAGIPAAYAGTYLNHRVEENYLLIGFSVLMVIAAVAMISGRAPASGDGDVGGDSGPPRSTQVPERGTSGGVATLRRTEVGIRTRRHPSLTGIVLAGLAVGLLTGFFGVGGGFVIVPALVLVLGLPMQQAVGTSLLVVAANSATSLVARVGTAHFDWSVIIPFTLAAMIATLAGKRLADRLPARRLKAGFAALLVLVAAYTAWQSIQGLTQPAAANTAASRSGSTNVATVSHVERQLAGGAGLIDVRTPAEYAAGHLRGATNIPLGGADFEMLVRGLDPHSAYVVYCASSRRAAEAIAAMKTDGFTRLTNAGGFEQLRAAGVPSAA